MPKAVVIRAAGINCDQEMVRAFELAGAATDLVHLDALIAQPARLEEYDLVGFPGGFSYGDDIASGRIFAMRVRERLYPALRAAAERGCPMIGACNGFQVLVQAGLLPGPGAGEAWPEHAPPVAQLALTDNIQARFVDDWIGMTPVASSVCLWTRPLVELASAPAAEDLLKLPVAHGEGRLVPRTPGLLVELEGAGQIALRYADNYNGSEGAVAGVCDATGRIFGLMPHPERFLEWNRHPYWTRLPAELRRGETPGLRMFRAAVEAATGARV
ncbi:MAG TPA: phosphoribosylformylglycinamidine synthase subunit PurQ [Phycisphaerales bacterium]|nr:phosphoribosylformylglycinamidine synthase subunit PurQ [Phycisphaerales bacterium]